LQADLPARSRSGFASAEAEGEAIHASPKKLDCFGDLGSPRNDGQGQISRMIKRQLRHCEKAKPTCLRRSGFAQVGEAIQGLFATTLWVASATQGRLAMAP